MQVLYNSDFFFPFKVQILSLATETIRRFPWSNGLTLFIFANMFARFLSLDHHSLSSVLLSHKNIVTRKKKYWLILLAPPTVVRVLVLETTVPLRCVGALRPASHLTTEVTTRTCAPELRFQSTGTFYCFVKHVSGETDFFPPFYRECTVVKNPGTPRGVRCHGPASC